MGSSRSFGSQVPDKSHLVQASGGVAAEVNDLREDIDAAMLTMEGQVAMPNWSESHIRLNVQPTEGDYLTIGTEIYEFVDSAGASAQAGAVEVLVGGAAATALTNIVAAINSRQNGTLGLYADVYNTDYLRVREATYRGSADHIKTGPGSDIAFAESITDTAVWSQNNFNLSGFAGAIKKTIIKLVVDAANLAADFDITLPFAPLSAMVLLVTNAAGTPDGTNKSANLTVVPARNAITVDLDGTGTDPVATDIVYIEAWGL